MKITKSDKTSLKQFNKVNSDKTNNQEIIYLKALVASVLKNKGLYRYHNTLIPRGLTPQYPEIFALLDKYILADVEVSYFTHINNNDAIISELFFIPSFQDAYILHLNVSESNLIITFGLPIKRKSHNNRYIAKLNPKYLYRKKNTLMFSLCFTNYQVIEGVLHNDFVADFVGRYNKLSKLSITQSADLKIIELFKDAVPITFSCQSITFIRQADSLMK